LLGRTLARPVEGGARRHGSRSGRFGRSAWRRASASACRSKPGARRAARGLSGASLDAWRYWASEGPCHRGRDCCRAIAPIATPETPRTARRFRLHAPLRRRYRTFVGPATGDGVDAR